MILLYTLLACGSSDPCADKVDLSHTDAGLALTEVEHPAGWTRTECFQCHQKWEIHADVCIDGVAFSQSDIPVDAPEDCVQCHGWNGVEAWKDLATYDTAESP